MSKTTQTGNARSGTGLDRMFPSLPFSGLGSQSSPASKIGLSFNESNLWIGHFSKRRHNSSDGDTDAPHLAPLFSSAPIQMAQILWTVAIACVLHDVTVNLRMYHPHEQKALMRRFHLAVWGAALFSMLLPFTTGSYGSTGSWCWIEQSDPRAAFDVGTMWRYLVLYCPLWAGEFLLVLF